MTRGGLVPVRELRQDHRMVVGSPLACEGVRHTYRTGEDHVVALSGVSKSFPAGAITTVAGPSGSGKSTLLRILAGVDRPDGGRVRVEDVELGRLPARRRRTVRRYRLAYMFQRPADNLLEYLTAAEQVRLAAEIRGAHLTTGQVHDLLVLLRIGDRVDHRPEQLSGGEQQRLALACAVAGSPAIVLADEPTAELDTASTDLVLEAMRALRDAGVAFAVSSHDPQVIDGSDHLLRLDRGEVTESW
jgi:putative ABC transport system ATP-binding protein